MPRLAPRHAFALAGLAVAAATLALERDVLLLPAHLRRLERMREVEPPPADPPACAATQRLRASLARLEEARARLVERVQGPLEAGDGGPILDGDPRWPAYWRARAAAWPEYAAAAEATIVGAEALAAEDPDDGAHRLVAGLVTLDLATSPAGFEPVWDHAADPAPGEAGQLATDEAEARWLRIEDPARLRRALEHLAAAVARPTLSFRTGELIAARWAEGGRSQPPLAGFVTRATLGMTVLLPELAVVKGGVLQTLRVARALRLAGRAPEALPLLDVARRVGLRGAAEGATIIEALVAIATLRAVERARVELAVAAGDPRAALEAAGAARDLERLREGARRLSVDRGRLGLLDDLMMPAGGWREGVGFTTDLGRRVDHALLESLGVLGLLAALAAALACAAWRGRAAPSPDAPAAGFSLGDLLLVVVPGAGAALALGLLLRLHPTRALGVAAPDAALAVAAQGVGVGLLALGLHRWRLRGAALARHGLRWRDPRAVRASLACGLVGVGLAVLWTGPHAADAAAPAAVLALAAAVVGWRGGLLGRAADDPAVDRAVRGYEGRVGVACLGAALALVGAVELTLVRPRRDALVRAYDVQTGHLLAHEADLWGGGEVREALRALAAPPG